MKHCKLPTLVRTPDSWIPKWSTAVQPRAGFKIEHLYLPVKQIVQQCFQTESLVDPFASVHIRPHTIHLCRLCSYPMMALNSSTSLTCLKIASTSNSSSVSYSSSPLRTTEISTRQKDHKLSGYTILVKLSSFLLFHNWLI